MRLILITAPQALKNEGHLLNSIFSLGCETVHLRKPGFSPVEYETAIRSIDSTFYSRLVLHSHHNLALAFNSKGIHFTEKDRVFRVPARLPGLTQSTGYHKDGLAKVSGAERDNWDYVFMSPIFDSISKRGYTAAFDEMTLRSTLACATVPVIALGGVTVGNIAAAREYGFHGVAVLGSVWEAPDPVSAYLDIANACKAAAKQ